MELRRKIFVFLLCLAMVFSLGGTVLAQENNPQQENTETETYDEIENENEIILNTENEEASQALEEDEKQTVALGEDEKQTAALGRAQNENIGSLTVTKTLVGNDVDSTKEFEFTITVSGTVFFITADAFANDAAINTLQGVTNTTVINFTLKGGDKETFYLTDGTEYTVEEKDYSSEGYETKKTGDTGTMAGNEKRTAAFTNTKNAKSRLTIKNILAGKNADKNKLFEFSIFLTDNTINENFSGVQFHQGGATIILKGDQSKIIEGLPDKVGYRIVQTDYSADGYATTSYGTEGIIDNDTPAVAEFTNTIYASDDSADYDDSGDKEKGKANDDEPETGDDSNMGLWLGSMALSLIGLTGVIIARRRKNSL